MTFYVITFGCKVNWCESEAITALMLQNGFSVADCLENADVVLVNSCTVTAETDRKIRQKINKIKKTNSSCLLVLMGCMAKSNKNACEKITGVDLILNDKNITSAFEKIVGFLENIPRVSENKKCENGLKFENLPLNFNSKRTRTFIKIQDGCNRFCSYCIIPYARGNIRSKPLKNIFEDVSVAVKNGFKEIILVGINLSLYGLDLGFTLVDAVRVACAAPGNYRVRLSSLEPEMLTESMISALSNEKKLCPSFHLSVQSGSDKILSLMRRKYTKNEYFEIIKNIEKYFKNVTITTDIIVGFPGETEENFQETLALIASKKFLKVNVFPYSPRPGTAAADFKDQIPPKIKSERVKRAIFAEKKSREKVFEENKGKILEVFYETQNKNDLFEGYTVNYILVKSKFPTNIRGKIKKTSLENFTSDYFFGNLIF